MNCDRSVVFSGYSGFLPQYNWNIVKSGVKHHQTNINTSCRHMYITKNKTLTHLRFTHNGLDCTILDRWDTPTAYNVTYTHFPGSKWKNVFTLDCGTFSSIHDLLAKSPTDVFSGVLSIHNLPFFIKALLDSVIPTLIRGKTSSVSGSEPISHSTEHT